jgi:hypothetical protein
MQKSTAIDNACDRRKDFFSNRRIPTVDIQKWHWHINFAASVLSLVSKRIPKKQLGAMRRVHGIPFQRVSKQPLESNESKTPASREFLEGTSTMYVSLSRLTLALGQCQPGKANVRTG